MPATWNLAQVQERKHWVLSQPIMDNEDYKSPYIEFLRRTFDFKSGSMKLEVGCGPYGAFHIRDDAIIGIDPHIAHYKEDGWSRWYTPIVGTAERLPFLDNCFELIFCLNFLDHMNPDLISQSVFEMHRVLKKDGKVYLYVDIGCVDDEAHFNLNKNQIMDILLNYFNFDRIEEMVSLTRIGNPICGVLSKKVEEIK